MIVLSVYTCTDYFLRELFLAQFCCQSDSDFITLIFFPSVKEVTSAPIVLLFTSEHTRPGNKSILHTVYPSSSVFSIIAHKNSQLLEHIVSTEIRHVKLPAVLISQTLYSMPNPSDSSGIIALL